VTDAALGSNETAPNCANCATVLASAQRYCGACGQRTGRARLTMRDIGHDFLHALTHVDQSILALVKALLLRPGHVAREYVEGKRKKYFGPFAFLVITVGLASFMIVVSGVKWVRSDAEVPIVVFLQQHVNILILAQMPLLASGCWLLFWSERLNFAEHLVLVAYTSGFRILVLALVALPLAMLVHAPLASVPFMGLYFGLWATYFAFAAAQFYRGSRPWVVVRAVIAAAIGQFLTMLLLGLVVVGGIMLTTH